MSLQPDALDPQQQHGYADQRKPCSRELLDNNQPAPRYCARCGLGPCDRDVAAADSMFNLLTKR